MISSLFANFSNVLTNNGEAPLWLVLGLLVLTFTIVYRLGGRTWAFLYVALIPFLNWSFGIIPEFQILEPNAIFTKGLALHPMTIVTGLVFVVRDFVQGEMRTYILYAMALAIAWSFFYAWPVIAIASGVAFAISEIFDWLLFTFTKYSFSKRILLSSAVATPIDTTLFLYGADLAKQMHAGQSLDYGSVLGLFSIPLADGNSLHIANWVVFIIGKMIGAFVVFYYIRRREKSEDFNAHEA